MSTNITERAAQVLVEIDDATAEALAWENLAWEKSLRCLKTAIEGLLKQLQGWQPPPNPAFPPLDCTALLTTLCDQWSAAQ